MKQREPEKPSGCFGEALDEVIAEGGLSGDAVIEELLFVVGISGAWEDAGIADEEGCCGRFFGVVGADFSLERAIEAIGDICFIFEVVHVGEAVLGSDSEEEKLHAFKLSE